MLPSRTTSACDHCRLRRRRCDRARPKCSFCVAQNVECIYGPATHTQPSQLVQELMSIRERLEFITPLLEPRLQASPQRDSTPPVLALQDCPPLVLKSPYSMQIIGLPSNLTSILYRLETGTSRLPVSPPNSTWIEDSDPDLILHRFQEQIHPWYPVLHYEFTLDFSPASTTSCLSHLVAAVSAVVSNGLHSLHYEAAQSMMAKILHESSVTGVQCLVLFSIYHTCLVQPRVSYEYIQAASLKLQPFLKSAYFPEVSPESHLVARLECTIYMIMSEISMHLNLSCSAKTLRSRPATVPMTRGMDTGNYPADWDTASSSTMSGILAHSEAHSPDAAMPGLSSLLVEMNLQQALDSYASSASEISTTCKDAFSYSDNSALPNGASRDMPACDINMQFPSLDESITGAVHRAKYHMYEVATYWPAIYRIILNGSADTELLPYGPLFFESVTSFLCAARIGLSLCRPKAWFLCASIYTVSIATARGLEVPALRLLAQPALLELLEGSVDALQGPSEISPSVRYMRESLRDRLDIASC
ncbi:hypothetical protein BJY00DRAFT_297558 [Aspergillus carlsbadensis]|nr:hypothetical protein BJY00DRAFT_297558 [Aspergillus carlsbadensis]